MGDDETKIRTARRKWMAQVAEEWPDMTLEMARQRPDCEEGLGLFFLGGTATQKMMFVAAFFSMGCGRKVRGRKGLCRNPDVVAANFQRFYCQPCYADLAPLRPNTYWKKVKEIVEGRTSEMKKRADTRVEKLKHTATWVVQVHSLFIFVVWSLFLLFPSLSSLFFLVCRRLVLFPVFFKRLGFWSFDQVRSMST